MDLHSNCPGYLDDQLQNNPTVRWICEDFLCERNERYYNLERKLMERMEQMELSNAILERKLENKMSGRLTRLSETS